MKYDHSPKKENNYNNPFPTSGRERNEIELKKEFIQKNISNDEYEEELNINNKIKREEMGYGNIDIYNNKDNIEIDKKEYLNYYNEDKENQSEYYEPEASNLIKNQTIFEATSQKSECCNLYKCSIY